MISIFTCFASAFNGNLTLAPYVETSAATGLNVEIAVNTLLDLLMDRIQHSTELQLANGVVQGIRFGENASKTPGQRCFC
ncbi:Ras-related protein Rab-27B [Trichinella pseudospiralis]|uniref:Ras-related protein Rab-27B n=1 Tax=Trichinella pseudospiralis TaxID=6337 RepID=A0A0V0XHE4_TRIPS|nr:Ras-related protein Rab-27B [Trichinella pseudospiralis]